MQLMRRQEASDLFREAEDLGIRLNRLLGLYRWPGDGAHEELTSADWARVRHHRKRERLPRPGRAAGCKVNASFKDGMLTVVIGKSRRKKAKGLGIAIP